MKRVYALSDIHIENRKNYYFLSRLLTQEDHGEDTLILAGDISHKLQDIDDAFDLFSCYFKHVFFSIGNHDLWIVNKVSEEEGEKKNNEKMMEKKKYDVDFNFDEEASHSIDSCKDSMEKIVEIQKLVKSNYHNVYVSPKRIYSDLVMICPILSWYDCEFDGEYLTYYEYDNLLRSFVCDYHLCKFDKDLTWKTYKNGVSEHLLDITKKYVDETFKDDPITKDDFVVTCSHFLPRMELCPDKSILKYKKLPKVLGSIEIDQYIRKLDSKLHVFGHSHINCDCFIDDIRYVQNAFGYHNKRMKEKEDTFKFPILEIDEEEGKIIHKSLRDLMFEPKGTNASN